MLSSGDDKGGATSGNTSLAYTRTKKTPISQKNILTESFPVTFVDRETPYNPHQTKILPHTTPGHSLSQTHLPPPSRHSQRQVGTTISRRVFKKKSPAFAVSPFHPNLTNVRWAVLMPLSRKITMELPFMEQWRNPQTNKWLGSIFGSHKQGRGNCRTATYQSQGAFNLGNQIGNSLVFTPHQPLVIPFQTNVHGRHIETDQHRNLDRQDFRGGDMPLHLHLNQIEDLSYILFRRIGVQRVLLPKNLKFDQPFQ